MRKWLVLHPGAQMVAWFVFGMGGLGLNQAFIGLHELLAWVILLGVFTFGYAKVRASISMLTAEERNLANKRNDRVLIYLGVMNITWGAITFVSVMVQGTPQFNDWVAIVVSFVVGIWVVNLGRRGD